MKNHIVQSLKVIVLVSLLGFGAQALAVSTWVPAPANPPQDNVDAPINVGSATQSKDGSFSVGGSFAAYLNSIFFGKVMFTNTAPSQTPPPITSTSGLVNINSTELGTKLINLKSGTGNSTTQADINLVGNALKFQTSGPSSTTDFDKFTFYSLVNGQTTATPLVNIQSGGKTIVGDVCLRSDQTKCLSTMSGGAATGGAPAAVSNKVFSNTDSYYPNNTGSVGIIGILDPGTYTVTGKISTRDSGGGGWSGIMLSSSDSETYASFAGTLATMYGGAAVTSGTGSSYGVHFGGSNSDVIAVVKRNATSDTKDNQVFTDWGSVPQTTITVSSRKYIYALGAQNYLRGYVYSVAQ